jgi:phage tail protein X
MSTIYTTRQGEMLDHICHKFYGDESGTVEKVLEVNPGLADLGPILPPRTKITLPAIERDTSADLVTLWD